MAAVAVALAVGVVLVDDDLGRARRRAAAWPPAWTMLRRTISSAARSKRTASSAVGTSGIEISGWAWST